MPRGPKPKPPGTTRPDTVREHDWSPAEGEGWQHGEVPEHPDGLRSESIVAWRSWFAGWWAAHWAPGDVPQLRLAILTYDRVLRGDEKVTALGILDKLGITPKGRQDLRWCPPKGSVSEAEHRAELDDLAAKRAERRKRIS